MLNNDKIKLLSLADQLLIEAEDRQNPLSIADQVLIKNIARNINSIRALINKA